MEIKKQAFEWNEITRRISEEPFDSTTRAIRMTTKGDAHKIGPSENTKGGRWDPLGDYLAKRRWVKALEKEIDRVLPGRGRTLTGDAKAYNRTFFSSLLPKMNATQVESLIDQVNREISERKAKELEELNGGTDYPTQVPNG